MTLPIEDQQLLMCAHEHCELWQVVSAVASVITMRQNELEPARTLLLKYVDKGWVSLARGARAKDGEWIPKPMPIDEARRIILTDENWELPSDLAPDDVDVVVAVLTQAGQDALAAGAAADAFNRIPKGPDC